ncbi:dephospho-CoA kinase [Thermosulfurimonas marina]|uniref:dephospho-CoA kinase n=1 Tax=Thermosulfurimonas marina TaxID=2047767 RepID=UPI00144ABCA4|nr:dephospho-CoA kinase [Thermosulfurimonas marina]
MRKVGITGGAATGKSTLLKILSELGYPVFSADEVVRRLLAPQGRAFSQVKTLCPWALSPEGTLDRRKILERMVRDESLRRKLEALLHPLVREELLAFFKEAESKGASWAFAEIPLLFEAGWEGLFDEIWVVTCKEDLQRSRLRERVGEELAEALLRLQWPLSEKVARAHRVFSSEDPPESWRRELQELLSRSRTP